MALRVKGTTKRFGEAAWPSLWVGEPSVKARTAAAMETMNVMFMTILGLRLRAGRRDE